MRIFAISDLHVDYEENRRWFDDLSWDDYQADILIVAGDITDKISLFETTLKNLRKRFSKLIYIPGNHDLWSIRCPINDSLLKLLLIKEIASDCGVHMEPFHSDTLSIIPIFGWYDYSFGQPAPEICQSWVDYVACRWPADYTVETITRHFLQMNEPYLQTKNQFIISCSHFLPRIDIMPSYIPLEQRNLYPVLGSMLMEGQIRKLGSDIHIYGHSHVNQQVCLDNITYINNAFGYPHETWTAKELKFVYEQS